MAFNHQRGTTDLDERNRAFHWKSQRQDDFPTVTQFDTQQGLTQLLVPGFSENEDHLSWEQLQEFQFQNGYNEVGVGLQPPFNPSNNELMQSPSGYQDRRSSAGLLSDHGFPDLSNQASPGYLDDQLDEQFGPRLVLEDDGDVSGKDASHPVAPSNIPWSSPYADKRGSLQLLSPDLTGTSSPASVTGDYTLAATVPISNTQANSTFRPRISTPPSVALQPQPFSDRQQYSPATSFSPANQQMAQLQGNRTQTSQYQAGNFGGMPSSLDRLQHTSNSEFASEVHIGQATSDAFEDRVAQERVHVTTEQDQAPASYSVERLDDGSWRPNENTGHSGLAPESRGAISNTAISTVEEQEQQRLLDERNADVEEWLTNNEVEKVTAQDKKSQLAIPVKDKMAHRRARSTGDQGGNGRELIDASHIPGPGMNVQEQSGSDEDADGSSVSAEGTNSPPVNVEASNQRGRSPLPSPPVDHGTSRRYNAQPWNDGPRESTYSSERYQPATSNAAMMKFYHRARDIETASRSATIGSRRHSDTDLESLFSVTARVVPPTKGKPSAKPKPDAEKPSGLFTSFMGRRGSSSLLKRKSTNTITPNQNQADTASQVPIRDLKLQAPKVSDSARRPRSPKIDTTAGGNRSIREPSSAISASSLTPWTQAKNVLRRTRSKSDISRTPGLTDLITQHGGPPMLKLASPDNDTEQLPMPLSLENEEDEPDVGLDYGGREENSIAMNMEVRFERIVPTFEGFKRHVLELNPRLPSYLADRIATEQSRRYRKLSEARIEHAKAVKTHSCPSKDRCFDLGGTSKLLPLRTSNKNTAATTAGFQVVASPVSEDDRDSSSQNDGLIVPAQFPSGIPIPPASRLPAEFECPLCFKVKQFVKPSDWTKHVHEDVSPFTCTFEICTETKSFKRKADWVRHENERHRHLESWNCNFPDCTHSCHRKDNFVQHLVREHGLPEPKVRTGRSMSGAAPTGPIQVMGMFYKDIWALIDTCKHGTTKNAEDEACCFCGNICGSWKKLTVHLAKHLEQISLPVLGLLEQTRGRSDRGVAADRSTTENFGLPQQIDFRPPPAGMSDSNWTRQAIPTAESGFPLHVETKPMISLPAQASLIPSSSSAQTYPPVHFNQQATSGTQGFAQGHSPIYTDNGMNSVMGQGYSPQPFQTGYPQQPSAAQAGVFPIANMAPAESGQQSFVSSPLDSTDFGNGIFTGQHTHSATYPGS